MVGVNMALHDAICECFEGAMLEPCLLKPCFHVAGTSAVTERISEPAAQQSTQAPQMATITASNHGYLTNEIGTPNPN